MKTLSQARDTIWRAIEAHGGATKVINATRSAPEAPPAVSVSMLYKFRNGNRLGPESVAALRAVLRDVDHETWLAAMGAVALEAAEAAP